MNCCWKSFKPNSSWGKMSGFEPPSDTDSLVILLLTYITSSEKWDLCWGSDGAPLTPVLLLDLVLEDPLKVFVSAAFPEPELQKTISRKSPWNVQWLECWWGQSRFFIAAIILIKEDRTFSFTLHHTPLPTVTAGIKNQVWAWKHFSPRNAEMNSCGIKIK